MSSYKSFRTSSRGFSFRRRSRRSLGTYILLFVVLLLLFVTLFTIFNNGRVVIREQVITISNLPADLEGFTILHISDLSGVRIGPKQRAVSQVLQNKSYNVACITGDMVGADGDPYPFYELITALDPTKPIFFINGDGDPAVFTTDDALSASFLAEHISGAQTRGARYLASSMSMTYRGHTIWFSPAELLLQDIDETIASLRIELDRLSAATYNTQTIRSRQEVEYRLEALEKEKGARQQIQESSLHIVMTHQPLDTGFISIMRAVMPQSDPFFRSIGLVLAGHHAGGQWQLPFIGPIYARPNGFFPSDIGGLTAIESYTQYISNGLGNASDTPFPGFRLFNAPEMTLIRLTSSL